MSREKIILNIMKQCDLSPNTVALHLKITPNKLDRWLKCKDKLPYKTVWMLGELFNLSQEDLINILDSSKRRKRV